MHLIKLTITGKGVGTDDFFETADCYFQSLNDSKQIINEEWQYEPVEGGVSLNLFCPEKDSYLAKNSTVYGKNWQKRMEEEFGCQFNFQYLGLAPEREKTSLPKNAKFFLLKTTRLSPLIDGESFLPIPLYKIPFTYHDGESHNDINFWENNYIRIEGLWMNGSVGERWAQNQLQNHDSELNKQGIESCRKIEEVTGIPTYYFLFNYRAWGHKKDKARKCPNCGGDWLIEGKTFNNFYAFKCDPCRLLSELSSNT
ncbi:DUF2310 family Zn-ribbon-containing protein [Rapidithrix thailandica]|uniref:DUF2310 family Zn-ribbon-containing protein n=1 Tax=Rapidithrix thailandica TaxID=413964 RepID=A0AAW9S2V7_9BACT